MRQQEDRSKRDGRLIRDSWIAGSCAGLLSTLMMHPLDVLRTKLQASSHHGTASTITHSTGGATTVTASAIASSSTPLQVFRHTWQNGGISALYTGLALPLLAQGIYKGTVFTVNNITQQWLLRMRTWENHRLGRPEDGTLNMFDRFLCGFVGGSINAAVFVTPVELVRNQLIAQHTRITASTTAPIALTTKIRPVRLLPHQTNVLNTWDFIRLCQQQKYGIFRLWKGIQWSVARDGFGCGFFFFTMEATQRFLLSKRSGSVRHQEHDNQPPLTITIVSGAAAGFSFWVVGLPFDTIKTWVQSSDITAPPIRAQDIIRSIYNQHGPIIMIQRLCRGWQVAYGRGIPSAAITVVVYSLVFRYLQP